MTSTGRQASRAEAVFVFNVADHQRQIALMTV
jgi:hypothetical protein